MEHWFFEVTSPGKVADTSGTVSQVKFSVSDPIYMYYTIAQLWKGNIKEQIATEFKVTKSGD